MKKKIVVTGGSGRFASELKKLKRNIKKTSTQTVTRYDFLSHSVGIT